MNRRIATDADLTEGSIVFKGNGKVQYRVWKILPATEMHETYYALQKVSSTSAPAARYYSASDLQVEVSTDAEGVERDDLGNPTETGWKTIGDREPFNWGSYHQDQEPVWAD